MPSRCCARTMAHGGELGRVPAAPPAAGQRCSTSAADPAPSPPISAERVAPGAVTAVEVPRRPRRHARRGAAARVCRRRAARSATSTPGAAGRRFDVVHAHQVLQHLADPVQALRESARVPTRWGRGGPGQRLRRLRLVPELPELERWLALYRAAARANGGEPDAGRHLCPGRGRGLRGVLATSAHGASPRRRTGPGGRDVGRPHHRVRTRRAADRLRRGPAGRAARGSPTAGGRWSTAADGGCRSCAVS